MKRVKLFIAMILFIGMLSFTALTTKVQKLSVCMAIGSKSQLI